MIEENVEYDLVVKEYSVAGLLYVENSKHSTDYFLLSPIPVTTWNYGQVVALVFECVPNYIVDTLKDGSGVYPYKRGVVVGVGSSWHVEYNIDKETIMVEEYEDVNE